MPNAVNWKLTTSYGQLLYKANRGIQTGRKNNQSKGNINLTSQRALNTKDNK